VVVSGRRLVPAADGRWLAGVVRRAVAVIGRTPAEISIRLVDDAGIADLHERWLGVPGPTDVITFDLAEPAAAGLCGDIAISVETARRMAAEVGWDARHEMAYYAIHGLLHLAGEDDHDPADRRRMRAREREVLVATGLPCPPSIRPRAPRRRP
jgi:probable rRNA maturation factor